MRRYAYIGGIEDPQEEQGQRRHFFDSLTSTRLEVVQGAIVTTTDATVTTLLTFPLNDNSVYLFLVMATARRTGGSAGTAGDVAGFVLSGSFRRNAAGNAVQIGSTTSLATHRDQAAWSVTLAISTTNVLVQGAGALNNNVSWLARAIFQEINA